MRWTVIWHPEVAEWRKTLDGDTYQQIAAAVDLLAEQGPALRRPFVGEIQASRHKNMKELLPGSSGRSEIRILFAFDTQRQAVLLVAGDKAGQWDRWYKRAVPMADDRFDEHLERMRRRRP